MLPDSSVLEQILLDQNIIKEKHVKAANSYVEKGGESFLEYLFTKNLISKKQLGEAIAISFNTQYCNILDYPVSKENATVLDADFSESFRVLHVKTEDNRSLFATDTPDDERLLASLKKHFPKNEIFIQYALPEAIKTGLMHFREVLECTFPEIAEKYGSDSRRLFDAILEDAIVHHTSDLHIEPQLTEVIIRFRVDGRLLEAGRIKREHYDTLLNLIKIRNKMRTDVHLLPLDGSMQIVRDRVIYDIRTSTAPIVDGQKVVMRILSSYVKVLSLQELGLDTQYQEVLDVALSKPYGIIIVSGPTGSGKTTTLYSLLKTLNHDNVNVSTIEDPVEYRIPGANQIQVNHEAGLTFPKGLRALVRQDPDVILVGEVRDSETADIAVNAALTGILVFTTFHAGDSAITIPRLLDLGIEPFIVASALELIMSQRLLRRVCEDCKVEYELDKTELGEYVAKPERFFKGKKTTLYKGKGCDSCGGSGYKGRLAIFESIAMTADMRELILKRPSAREVWELAAKQGSTSLFENGVVKVLEGITTIDELVRVAQPWDD